MRKSYKDISDYTLECVLATLMNLSMRTKGKDQIEGEAKLVVALLKGLF